MQHVRIATYGINKGTLQELAETAKSGILPKSCRSPASSATAWPTWVTGRPYRSACGRPGTRQRPRLRWRQRGSARTWPTALS
jgi:hypothetical protein